MVTDQKIKHKFNWGDAVKIASPELYSNIEKGTVCGIRIIEDKSVSYDFNEPIGTVLYLVEGQSGIAKEIPERFVSLL